MAKWTVKYSIEQYEAKTALFEDRGFLETDTRTFYRDLFPEGSLQRRDETATDKGNILCTRLLLPDETKRRNDRAQARGEKRAKIRNPQWVICDDLELIEKAVEPTGKRYGLLPPLSFFGRTKTARNADRLFSLTIDVDLVGEKHLKNLLWQFGDKTQRPILPPTYLVNSGTGVHLYYFLKEPVRLFPNMLPIYSELKKALMLYVWNDFTSDKDDKSRDIKPITQGFRAVGSLTKLGTPYLSRAYLVSGQRYTLEEIKTSIPGCDIDLTGREGRTPIYAAAVRWPDWYLRRIVKKEPRAIKGAFRQNRALYDWFIKDVMRTQIREGGRYHSIIALCGFGLKCGVTDREIRKDARSFLDYYDSLTETELNHFTLSDINTAIKYALAPENRERTMRTTRKWVEDNCNIIIKPSITRRPKNKRLNRYDSLKVAREYKAAGKLRGTVKDGRPSKAGVVQAWRENNPEGRKTDCIKETGLSKSTVYRHWEQTKTKKKTFSSYKDIIEYMETLDREELDRFINENRDAIRELEKE